MLGRYILFVVGVCGFAIAVVPGDSDDVISLSDRGEAAPKLGLSSTADSASSDWYSGSHALNRAGDGHFYADATIGGAPVRMMVDTGATVIALTGDDAAAAGLQWDPADVRQIGRGASGDVYGVAARLDSVEVGGFVRRDINAVIIPEGLDVSLLGQSYLSKIGSVKIVDDTMVMGQN